MKKDTTSHSPKIEPSKLKSDLTDLDIASSIINNTSDAIIATDPKGEITFWNNGAEEIYGYTSEEVLGKNITIIYKNEDLPLLGSRIKKVIEGENFANTEVTVIDKFKNEHSILLSINGLKDSNGEIIQLVGITKDITEIKHAEIKLNRTEALFSSAISAIGEGFVVQDLSDKILSANQAAANILGLTMNQLLGKDSFDPRWRALHEDGTPFNPEDHPSVRTGMTGEPVHNVVMNVHTGKDTRKWILINSRPVLNENNIHTSTVTTFLDITDRKIVEEKIKESEQRFIQAFDNSPIPMSILNLKTGKRLAVNNTFCNTFGYSKDDLINNENIHKINLAVNQKEFNLAVKKCLSVGTIFEHPFSMITKSGEIRNVLVNATKAYTNNKDIYITSFLDVTERTQAVDALRASEKKFRNLAESAKVSISIFEASPSKKYLYVSPYWEKFTGYSSKESKKLDFLALAAPEDHILLNERTAKRLAGHKLPDSFEMKLITKTGETKWVDYTAVIGEFEGIKSILVSALDITSRKLSEENLKETLSRLNLAVNTANLGVWSLDIETGELEWNEKLFEIYGLAPSDFDNTMDSFTKRVHPEDLEHVSKQMEIGLQNKSVFDVNFRIIRPNGEVREIEGSTSSIIVDGKMSKMIGYDRDITEQKLAQKALKESEEKYRSIFEQSLVGIGMSKGDEVIYANNAMLEIFKYKSLEEYIKIPLIDHIAPSSRKIIEDRRKQLMSNNAHKLSPEFQYDIICKDGEIKTLLGHTIRTELNGETYNQTVVVDITQRVKQEKELISAKNILEEGKTKFEILSNVTFEGIVIHEKGVPVDLNNAFPEMFGYTKDEFKNEDLVKLIIHKDYHNLVLQNIENEYKLPYEVIGIKKDGTEFPAEVEGKTYVSKENKKLRVTAIRDITDRKAAELEIKNALNEIIELKQQIEAENIYLKEELKLEGSYNEIVGSSKSLRKVLKQVEQVAKTDSTVLILGETGTGKELIAKAVHDASDRKNKPLVKVNCSALPRELIESELFGHEKGAFTSAVNRKIGRFELANSGTIFLDEIGDLPIALQTRLLRVLQESEFERVGGETTIKVDVRVITATNRNLKKRVEENKFRQDLFYRLNVFPITCPPLRDRLDDIPILVNHFVNKYNHKVNKKIKTVNQKSIDRLMKYQWPGNIRELEHVIERGVIMNEGKQLRLGSWFMDSSLDNVVPDDLTTLEVVERNYIVKVLEETNWRIRGKNGAAEILGMKPTTLESRMKKLEINR